MPILLQTAQASLLVDSAPFANEAELQSVLSDNPSLLSRPSDPPIALVQREVELPEAGHLDLLCVTSNGLPVVVEVKLARNGESRRQVVAQIIDYVSSLTLLTVDELDNAVGGGLDAALRRLEQQGTPGSFDQVWQQVGGNLRSGLARVVLVLDEAPPDLERIVRFLAQRSNLDVRLVTVAKYTHSAQGTFYVPNIVVDASAEQSTGGSSITLPPKAELMAAVGLYDASAPADLRTRGRAYYYRQVRPADWPYGVHYEFYQTSYELGTELHLETDKVRFLAPILASFDGATLTNGSRVTWDPKYAGGRGRLMIKHSLDADPATVADDMKGLLELTCSKVTAASTRAPGMVP